MVLTAAFLWIICFFWGGYFIRRYWSPSGIHQPQPAVLLRRCPARNLFLLMKYIVICDNQKKVLAISIADSAGKVRDIPSRRDWDGGVPSGRLHWNRVLFLWSMFDNNATVNTVVLMCLGKTWNSVFACSFLFACSDCTSTLLLPVLPPSNPLCLQITVKLLY